MYETAGAWCDVGSDRNAMSVFVKTGIASCRQFSMLPWHQSGQMQVTTLALSRVVERLVLHLVCAVCIVVVRCSISSPSCERTKQQCQRLLQAQHLAAPQRVSECAQLPAQPNRSVGMQAASDP